MRRALRVGFLLATWFHASYLWGDNPFRAVFVGDIMLDGGPGHYLSTTGDPFAEFDVLFRLADCVVGNLECAITTEGRAEDKPFTFLGLPSAIPVLKRHFTALSLANNHACDWGKEGFLDQLERFEQAKLGYFGGGRNAKEARRPFMVERNGRRAALLGYNDFPPKSFAAGKTKPGIAWLHEKKIVADLRAARAEHGADFVLLMLHWGEEETNEPTAEQKELAHRLIDAGADAIVGAHPHVIQPLETYRGKPIFYSLGNFVFDYFPQDPPKWTGWIAEIELTPKKDPKVAVHEVELDAAGIPHKKGGLVAGGGKR